MILKNILLTVVIIKVCSCSYLGLPADQERTAKLIQVYKDGTRVFRYFVNDEARYVYVTNDENGFPVKIKYSEFLNVPGEIISKPIDFKIPGGPKKTVKYVNPIAKFAWLVPF